MSQRSQRSNEEKAVGLLRCGARRNRPPVSCCCRRIHPAGMNRVSLSVFRPRIACSYRMPGASGGRKIPTTTADQTYSLHLFLSNCSSTATMSSNTSPNDAKVSAAADQLASLKVTEGQGSTKSSGTSTDGAAARASEKGAKVLDPDLWKPHPPTEECPVCFVPLPLDENTQT